MCGAQAIAFKPTPISGRARRAQADSSWRYTKHCLFDKHFYQILSQCSAFRHQIQEQLSRLFACRNLQERRPGA
jgi:hypothetical protein